MYYTMGMIHVTIDSKRVSLWSRDHARCVECGTTRRRHMARGYCQRCWNRVYGKKFRARKKKESTA
jgi:hypothetical protein